MWTKTALFRRIAYGALLLPVMGAMSNPGITAYHVVRSPSGGFRVVTDTSAATKPASVQPALAQPMFSGSFSPAVNFAPGGSFPLGVAAAVLRTELASAPADVVLVDCGSNVVGVLLGNGDGTLQAPVTYASGGSCPQAIAIGDVNADGIPDLVVSNQGGGPNGDGAVAVLLGNGDGTFQSAQVFDSGGTNANENIPAGIVIADLNGDGIPDIAVANQTSLANADGSIAVLLGAGGGNFLAAVTYDSGGITASGLVATDVNDDGYPDLLVANNCQNQACVSQQGSVAVLLNSGTTAPGTFSPAVSYVTPGPAATLAAGNLGTGSTDILVGLGTYGTALLIGNGDGTFQSAQALGGAGQVSAVAIQDVNGDGINDLVIGLGYCGACDRGNDSGVAVNLGVGGGSFQGWGTPYDSAGVLIAGLAFADFNGDGIPDLVAANSCDSGNIDSRCGGNAAVFLDSAASLATAVSASVNPADVGQKVTYTATVTNPNGVLSGTITFRDGTTVLSSQTGSTGTASFTTTYTATESHNITAQFAPNTYEYSLSPLLTESVLAKTAIKVSTSGSPSFVGQSVTLTAAITSTYGPIPDGEAVGFSDESGTLGSASTLAGVATFVALALPAGHHVITASYPGDGTFASSSGTVSQQVNLYSSTVSMTSSSNPSTYGQSVTFAATVSSSSLNAPTGSVTFKRGAITLGKVSIAGGIAGISTSALGAGTTNVVATYSGDNAITGSSSSVSQTVNPASVAVTLSSSLNPSTYGKSITFTASLASSTGVAVNNGSVRFTADGTTIGGCASASIPVPNTATCVTSSLLVGSHSIVATYSPGSDPDYTGGSGTLTGGQTVLGVPSATTVASNINPSVYAADTLIFTAKVTSSAAVTGTVAFTDNGANIYKCGAVSLASGSAVCFTQNLINAGTHTIAANYSGTATIAPSSAQLQQVITKLPTGLTMTSSANPSTYAQSVSFTATFSPPQFAGGGETIQFTAGGTVISGCSAVMFGEDTATCTTSSLAVGSHTIVASFAGTSNLTSSRVELVQKVNAQ